MIGYGYEPRAVHACHPEQSRGRRVPEPDSPTRTAFQRDRDRIIHSTAFRRLKHKTQVFVAHEMDHYRTRLTHTIEVAQIARALARSLRLDQDLAEAVALVHDFGHTPFGHSGEDVLNERLAPWGGFDHNAQSLRIVTRLENRYAAFEGLNLTWETLEGLVKHNGPLTGPHAPPDPVSPAILAVDRAFPLDLHRHASLEAQCAAIADDIAYDTHDIDDGLRSGLLDLEMLEEVPLCARILGEIRARHPQLDPVRMVHELTRRQITAMVEDVVTNTLAGLAQLRPESADEVRDAGRALVAFGEEMQAREKELKEFLFQRLYRHPDVLAVREVAERVVSELFDAYMADPGAMPENWRSGMENATAAVRARHIGDFLAGMTDTYALKEYRRLFDRNVQLG